MSYGNSGFCEKEGSSKEKKCDCKHGSDNNIPSFLARLSPGIQVQLQYNDQPPARGTYQGFEHGNVILTDYNGFPGLVRITPDRINAVAPFGYGHGDKEKY